MTFAVRPFIDLNSTDVTGVLPAASGGAGWSTALSLDFSAEANQTLSSDTNYTIGGLTFKKENSANEASAADVLNGSGLRFRPNAAGTYFNGTRTVPLVWLALSQILTGTTFDWTSPLRVEIELDSDNAGNGDFVFAGVDTDSMEGSYVILRGGSGGNNILASDSTFNSTTTQQTGPSAITIGNSVANSGVIAMGTAIGISGGGGMAVQAYAHGTPMPAVTAFQSYAPQSQAQTTGIANLSLLDASGVGVLAKWGVILGAVRANVGYTTIIKKLRVTYRP